jgi:hypothetical protein
MIDFNAISDELRGVLADVTLPEVALVEQTLATPAPLADIDAAVRDALASVRVPLGRIAIGVGSRGIARIDEIVRALVAELKCAGASPFVVPAMGSHGASNAEGQARVLAHLGVTEETVGAPIRATMDTVHVGTTAAGIDAFLDAEAYGADAIVVVNRVKLHTSFRGPIESGPTKMLAIGLGNRDGARSVHAPGWLTMHENVPAAARVVLATGKIAFALAILENADELPYRIVGLPAERLIADEEALLSEVRDGFPRLPFDELDVLVVDRDRPLSEPAYRGRALRRAARLFEPHARGGRQRQRRRPRRRRDGRARVRVSSERHVSQCPHDHSRRKLAFADGHADPRTRRRGGAQNGAGHAAGSRATRPHPRYAPRQTLRSVAGRAPRARAPRRAAHPNGAALRAVRFRRIRKPMKILSFRAETRG